MERSGTAGRHAASADACVRCARGRGDEEETSQEVVHQMQECDMHGERRTEGEEYEEAEKAGREQEQGRMRRRTDAEVE